MERFLWFISHFSARILVVVLLIPTIIWFLILNESEVLVPYIASHRILLISVSSIILIISLFFGFLGGKVGYKYVNMGRSRRWQYTSTTFSRNDNTFMNILYWGGKFALIPIIIVLLILAIIATVNIITLTQ